MFRCGLERRSATCGMASSVLSGLSWAVLPPTSATDNTCPRPRCASSKRSPAPQPSLPSPAYYIINIVGFEFPTGIGCAGIGHSVALTLNPQPIMVECRDVGKRRSRHSAMGALTVPPILLIVADEVIEQAS